MPEFLIFEHFIGGGMRDTRIPNAIVPQASAMMWSLASDLLAADETAQVHVLVDDRIDPLEMLGKHFDSGRLKMIRINKGVDLEAQLRHHGQGKKCVIIAPESGGVLLDWRRKFDAFGLDTLNCTAPVLELTGDKQTFATYLDEHEVAHPQTMTLKQMIERGEAPAKCMLKPVDGVGCDHTYLINAQALMTASDKQAEVVRDEPERWLIQEWIDGEAASLFYHAGPSGITLLGAGWQCMYFESFSQSFRSFTHLQMMDRLKGWRLGQCHYIGGEWPLPVDATLACLDAVKPLLNMPEMSGLNGYFGVDLILPHDNPAPFILELNPRLTYSYVGLSKLRGPEMAAPTAGLPLEADWRSQLQPGQFVRLSAGERNV